MALSAATTEQKPPRRTVPLKATSKQRHPAAYQIWKSVGSLPPGSWDALAKVGAHEKIRTHLGLLYIEGQINENQANAGVYFAKFCAKADHYLGMPKRNAASPDYEKGYRNSRNDEEAVAILNGTIKDFEARCKWVHKKWNRIHGFFGDEKVFSLLIDVCVNDQHCPVMEISKLRAALELLVIKLGIDRIRPEDQPRMRPKRRNRRPKQEGTNDRRRDPSSYYNRDREDIQLIPPSATIPEPQDS
jgi:hypothetical protein